MFPDTVRRWLYRRRHANRMAGFLNAAQARLAAVGVGPRWLVMVEVTGRRSGKTIAFPAVIADYDKRPVPSVHARRRHQLGTQRPRVRGHAVLRHSDREPVMLHEVDIDQRAPILRCYLQRAPGPEHTFLSIGGRPSKRSNQSQRNTRCPAQLRRKKLRANEATRRRPSGGRPAGGRRGRHSAPGSARPGRCCRGR